MAHALYANTILRGLKSDAFAPHIRPTGTVEVIEELNPCYNVTFSFRVPEKITSVTLEPQGKEIPFEEKRTNKEIVALVEGEIKAIDGSYFAVVSIDRV